MNERVKILLGEAGKLARDDQIDLVESIMINLPPDPEWDKAWAEEAERRLEAVRRGETETHDADEVFAGIRKRLTGGRHRRHPREFGSFLRLVSSFSPSRAARTRAGRNRLAQFGSRFPCQRLPQLADLPYDRASRRRP